MNTQINIIGILSLFLGIHLVVAQTATARTMGSSKTADSVIAQQTTDLSFNQDLESKPKLPSTGKPTQGSSLPGGTRYR